MLAYLGQAYMEGRSRELKEYSIGRDVMGKHEDYDPRIDSSVRVQISKLRQRLDQHYATEGQAVEHQIRLPKGHFELVLETRTAPPQPPPAPPAESNRWKWAAIALGLALLVVVAANLSLWFSPGMRVAVPVALSSPEMRSFWLPFVDSERPLTVVLGSPLFIRFHSSYFRDPWVNSWDEARQKLPLEALQEALGSPTPAAETHRWAPFGEAVAAFRIAQFLSPARNNLQIRRSSVLSFEHLRSSDLIVVGPRKFNPQIHELPVQQDFVIEEGEVRNLRPLANEQAVYRRQVAPEVEDIPDDYAVITRIHGAKGWGEILVLASPTTEGTWAAAEYVSNPTQLSDMMRRISPDLKSVPERYQVLIRCRFKNQVPLQSDYLTHHVLEERTQASHAGQ
ncbi:MAG: hypothetical protein KIT83_15085 [Bryobacterales bacterium]|nr:hypothetical protein [Bryobacterales bacterium]